MATLDIKFTKFDNRPWGFRLAGGSDFPEPLTVIRVSEGSLAECMGLKVGDVVVKLNDQPISDMTHGQAHEALTLAGNNFVLAVRRTEDPSKAIEGIEDKIEPYMLPIEEILFAPADDKKEATPDEVPQIEQESAPTEDKLEVEEYPEKPRDINSDPLPKTDLTEEEIAQLILDEEEVLNDKGVLGVNFKKIRPRAPLLKKSEVFRELQNEIAAEPEEVQERKRQSTFLQKPDRPAPKPRVAQEETEPEVEPYRVVIKKQPKRPITERLLKKGLLDPSRARTPDTVTSVTTADTTSEKTTPAATPEPTNQSSDGGSRPQSVASVIEIVDQSSNQEEAKGESHGDQTPQPEPRIEEPADDEEEDKPVQVVIRRPSKAEVDVEVEVTMDRDKIKELVTTEISLERQLASVQSQLLALKQLPSEIEKHLKIVSEQLHKIMELSGVDQQQIVLDKSQADERSQAEEPSRQEEEAQVCSRRDEQEKQQQQQTREEEEQSKAAEEERRHEEEEAISDIEETSSSYPPHLADTEYSSSYYANLAEDNTEDDATWRSDQVEISVKSNEDDGQHRVKKYIVTYESKVVEETRRAQRSTSRDPSPADVESIKSFEADPNLTLQQQLVEEFKHRKGRKRDSRDHLWQPQAKQLELTYGRRWRCPNDFFNDEMIADVLSSQAEVIRGRALGVNFKKFEKVNALPNYDHLMNSSVYKMIHKMDAEPKKGIPARPPKVLAAEDIIERVNTPVCGMSSNECVRS